MVRSAAIYARISSDQDGTGLGVRRQVKACRELAAQRGWTVAGEYVDNDVSAYSGKRPRPQYERMVADIRAGDLDAVIVYNLDRLTRRPMELEQFAATCEQAGMTNVATVSSDVDLGNDDGLFVARIFAAFAAKESGRKSDRVRAKMTELAAAGRPHGGSVRPFGYEPDRITVRPDEAALIRTLAERYLAGESVRSLAAWLADQGVPTAAGKPWRSTTVKGLLASGRIAGLREHHGEVVGEAMWNPIITPAQHDRIVAAMTQRAVTRRRTPRRYLLSGLLRCGRCDNRLYASPRGERRGYVCLSGPDHGGCGRLTVVADPLERLVEFAVLHRLDSGALADALTGRAGDDEASAALVESISDDTAQLDEAAAAYAARQISMREWLDVKKFIETRKHAAERRLATITNTQRPRRPGRASATDPLTVGRPQPRPPAHDRPHDARPRRRRPRHPWRPIPGPQQNHTALESLTGRPGRAVPRCAAGPGVARTGRPSSLTTISTVAGSLMRSGTPHA
jgi:DNA invertase Pin-like site-specific DNA recombinase